MRLVLVIALRALKHHVNMTRPINLTAGAINLIERWLKDGDPPFKVTVTGYRDSHLWYADKVGQVFTVERITLDGYWAREPSGYINIIFFEDAK